MAVPAAAYIAAPIVGGIASAFGQHSANKTNERIARENRAFQERMSSTAWQRGVKDMRAAGINPMAAYSSAAASSPGGSTAQAQNVASEASATAMQALRVKEELKLLQEQRRFAENQADEMYAKAGSAGVQYRLDQDKEAVYKHWKVGKTPTEITPYQQFLVDDLAQKGWLNEEARARIAGYEALLPGKRLIGSAAGTVARYGVPALGTIGGMLAARRFNVKGAREVWSNAKRAWYRKQRSR